MKKILQLLGLSNWNEVKFFIVVILFLFAIIFIKIFMA